MKRLCMAFIRFYQKCLSPMKRRGCCRFYPTCSSYGLEAFEKRGFFAGLLLTVLRILRCNPFCRGGYDPVPDKGFRRYRPPKEQETSAIPKPIPKYRRGVDLFMTDADGAAPELSHIEPQNAESERGTAPGAEQATIKCKTKEQKPF